MKFEYGISIELSPGLWKRAALTMEDNGKETPEEFMSRVANTVEKWMDSHTKPSLSASAGELSKPEADIRASTIAEIYASKTIPMLETYKYQVNTHPDIKAAYEQQLARLKNEKITLP